MSDIGRLEWLLLRKVKNEYECPNQELTSELTLELAAYDDAGIRSVWSYLEKQGYIECGTKEVYGDDVLKASKDYCRLLLAGHSRLNGLSRKYR